MAGREEEREADEIRVNFETFKTSLQVKVFRLLFCLISLQIYCSIKTVFSWLFSVKLKCILRCVLKCKKFGSHFFMSIPTIRY